MEHSLRHPTHPQRQHIQRRSPWETSTRSEEHTSEPQSQSNLVCRLLLEKTTVTGFSCVSTLPYCAFGTQVTCTSTLSELRTTTLVMQIMRVSMPRQHRVDNWYSSSTYL